MSEQVGAGALDGRLLFSYVKCMSQELGEAVLLAFNDQCHQPIPLATPHCCATITVRLSAVARPGVLLKVPSTSRCGVPERWLNGQGLSLR